jgi:hypothetical protein
MGNCACFAAYCSSSRRATSKDQIAGQLNQFLGQQLQARWFATGPTDLKLDVAAFLPTQKRHRCLECLVFGLYLRIILGSRIPIRFMLADCCARAVSGHAAAPLASRMKSRRRMLGPRPSRRGIVPTGTGAMEGVKNGGSQP